MVGLMAFKCIAALPAIINQSSGLSKRVCVLSAPLLQANPPSVITHTLSSQHMQSLLAANRSEFACQHWILFRASERNRVHGHQLAWAFEAKISPVFCPVQSFGWLIHVRMTFLLNPMHAMCHVPGIKHRPQMHSRQLRSQLPMQPNIQSTDYFRISLLLRTANVCLLHKFCWFSNFNGLRNGMHRLIQMTVIFFPTRSIYRIEITKKKQFWFDVNRNSVFRQFLRKITSIYGINQFSYLKCVKTPSKGRIQNKTKKLVFERL